MGTFWSSENSQASRIIVLGTGCTGKSTICKSILLSYHNKYEKQYYNDTIEQLRINCMKQMEWLLSHRYSYGYWEHPQQDKSKDSDEMKEDIKLIKEWRSSNKFSSLWDYQIRQYGQAMSRLWNHGYINNLYKARTQRKGAVSVVMEGNDGRYWLDEMEYWFHKIQTVMTTQYTITDEDYLRIHKRTDWNQLIGNEYNDLMGNRYKIKDVGGDLTNWTFNTIQEHDCVIYVCALNHYAHGRSQDNRLKTNLDGIKDAMEQFAKPNQAKTVVLLNKVDIFKKFLYYTPLTFCFEDEYKGRNYGDYGDKQCGRIIQRICEELVMNDGRNLRDIISDDVAGIICTYCHLKIEYWLDLVCEDGIEFIKGKVLEIDPKIDIYVTNATDMDQVRNVMEEIHSKLQLKQK